MDLTVCTEDFQFPSLEFSYIEPFILEDMTVVKDGFSETMKDRKKPISS